MAIAMHTDNFFLLTSLKRREEGRWSLRIRTQRTLSLTVIRADPAK